MTSPPKQIQQQRYLYQGQSGFDASKTMEPAPDLSHTFSSKASGAEKNNDPLNTFAPNENDTKSKNKAILFLAKIVFVFLLVITSLGIALSVVSFKPVVAELLAVTHSQQDYEVIRSYQNVGGEVLSYVTTLPFEEVRDIQTDVVDLNVLGLSGFTEDEICHLTDVRVIMGPALLLTFILAPLIMGSIAYGRNTIFVRSSLFIAGFSSIIIPILILVFVVTLFEPTFVLFHEIFFPQGNWEFYSGTLIISTFPQAFWQSAGVLWMVLFILNGLIMLGLSRFCAKSAAFSVTNP